MFFQKFVMALVAVVVAAIAGSAQGLVVGKKAPAIMLEGKHGGRVDGTAWKSGELTGKVHAVFYVDPDEQEINEHVEQALNKEAFPLDKYDSVAIVNMGATWIPNFLISKRLEAKQKQFTHTTFVKDQSKVLVRAWGLLDNSYHVLVFDKSGNVAWSKGGKLSSEDVSDLIATIRRNLNELP